MTTRTARECEIRWLGEQHPAFNHKPWDQEEVLKLKSLAAEFMDGRPDWMAIAKRLGVRRNISSFQISKGQCLDGTNAARLHAARDFT